MVHLDECFEQAALKVSGALGSSIDGVEISTFKEIGTCFGGWFFKSTTNLYGFDIGLPWYFGLFCLNFCIGGIAMLVLKPKWAATTIFPYDAFAYILIFIQGELFHFYLRFNSKPNKCFQSYLSSLKTTTVNFVSFETFLHYIRSSLLHGRLYEYGKRFLVSCT